MYLYNEIKVVHLETTNKCNAFCPQCLRNVNGGKVNPRLQLTELRLDDVKNIFSVEFIKNLNRMYMCGNYGEPIVARDCLEIYKYFREKNSEMILNMNTNGSARSESWWKELAKVINGKGNVKFGLDGLGDTHSVYRQGTDWKKIVRNAKAFISAGGSAVWEFIVFEHNEHQIKEAEKISQNLGFQKFTIKKTWRFFSNVKNQGKDSHQGITPDGKDVVLKKPKNKEYLNDALQKEKEIINEYGSIEDYLKKVRIECKVNEEKSIYVSAEGLVFPCCWLANQLYIWYLPEKEARIWKFIERNGGIDKLNALKFSLKDIVDGDFFQKILPQSWNSNKRLDSCAKICGKDFDPFRSQYE